MKTGAVYNGLLHRCETWSFPLWEQHQLKTFEKRVLRIGTCKENTIITRRKLCNEELHNLYSSPNNMRRIRSGWIRSAGHVALMTAKCRQCSGRIGSFGKTQEQMGEQ
jgi:hypothetical protein